MDLAKIKEILETESSVFKEAVQSAIDQAVERRVQMKAQIAESLKLDEIGEMSEQDFFTVLDGYEAISGHLDAVLDQAGFSSDVRSSWLNKKDSPRPKFRRPTVQMLLEVIIDYYADNRLFHDMHGVLEDWGHSETISMLPDTNRAKLLSQKLDDFDQYQGLSVRIKNGFKNNNIITVGDLVSHTENELLRIPYLGRKSRNDSVHFVTAIGLSLGCLSKEEKEAVKNRFLLNATAEQRIFDEWEGQADSETIKADSDLLKALAEAGIHHRTQLATAPDDLLNVICAGHSGWYEQLPLILNGKSRRYDYGRVSLNLNMSVPPYLDGKVRTYQSV